MKPNKRSIIHLAVAAGMLISLGSANAAVVATEVREVGLNGFVSTNTRIGTGGNSNARFAVIGLFSVQSILADTGLTVAQLATTDFTVSFNTTSTVLLSAGTYTADYLGFVANADIGPASFWTGQRAGFLDAAAPSTGVADTLAIQTGITSQTFNLIGITEADSANDYIVVGMGYSTLQANNVSNTIGSITLTAIPEPSIALLGGLGFLALLRRRR